MNVRTAGVASESLSLSARDRALLHAVAAGRCDLVAAEAPELKVDGRWYCDQSRAGYLVAAGLLTSRTGGPGRVPAVLTPAGRTALAS